MWRDAEDIGLVEGTVGERALWWLLWFEAGKLVVAG